MPLPPPNPPPIHWLTADEVLSPYVYVFYAAFLTSFVFTPIMRSVAMYYGVIDRPDKIRKMHKTPVAYLGGVAVFLGWLAGLAMSQFLYMHRTGPGSTDHVVVRFSIVGAACMIVALGLWDDLRAIRPYVKIFGQVAAAVVLLSAGVGTKLTQSFIDAIVVRIGASVPGFTWANHPVFFDNLAYLSSAGITIGVVVFCCNATNLMDGLDGLCGGVTAIITSGFVFLATYLAMHGAVTVEGANLDAVRVVLGLALLGGVLGFVPYNFNPASIFMGDTGSMFLGFSCATLILMMADVEGRWFLASTVMFALPIMDTSLAFARRWVNGRPLFSADKFHFHHQLVSRGFTVRRAVVTLYGLAIFFALAGGAIVFLRQRYVICFYLVLFGYIIVAAYKMGMVHEKTVIAERKALDKEALNAAPNIESSSVLEIRDSDEPAAGSLAARRGTTVAGGWSDRDSSDRTPGGGSEM